MPTRDFNLTKPAYSINEVLEIMPFGRTKLYSAIKNGNLTATKFGKSTWILAPDLTAFLSSLQKNGGNYEA
jgi:hypothetical protein